MDVITVKVIVFMIKTLDFIYHILKPFWQQYFILISMILYTAKPSLSLRQIHKALQLNDWCINLILF